MQLNAILSNLPRDRYASVFQRWGMDDAVVLATRNEKLSSHSHEGRQAGCICDESGPRTGGGG